MNTSQASLWRILETIFIVEDETPILVSIPSAGLPQCSCNNPKPGDCRGDEDKFSKAHEELRILRPNGIPDPDAYKNDCYKHRVFDPPASVVRA